MPSPFLSDQWFHDAKAVREKYAGQAKPFGHKIRMNQVITEVPFGEGHVRLFVDTSNGEMALEQGALDAPDLTVTVDYATAKSILVDQDPAAAMQAFMAGKIKVQGDMTKLMALQATPPDEVAKQIAAEIKDITS